MKKPATYEGITAAAVIGSLELIGATRSIRYLAGALRAVSTASAMPPPT